MKKNVEVTSQRGKRHGVKEKERDRTSEARMENTEGMGRVRERERERVSHLIPLTSRSRNLPKQKILKFLR